jgi:hypothetical protein
MGASIRTVQRTLDELEEHRLISVEQRGLSQTNVYRLLKLPYSILDTTPVSLQDTTTVTGQDTTPVSHKEYSGLQYSIEEETVDRDILQAVIDLPDWKVSTGDLQWVNELKAEFPNLTVSLIHNCRDWHIEHHPNKRRVWKTSLRNWLDKDRKLNPAKSDDPGKYTNDPVFGHLVQQR